MWGDGVTANDDVGTDITATIPDDGVYTASCYVLYPFALTGETREVTLAIWQTVPTNIIAISTKPTDIDWQRLTATASLTAGTVGVSLYLGTNDVTRIVYFDGVQLEAGGVASTYFDGSTLGFGNDDSNNYYWLGVPHQSESKRLTTRSGGKIENFSEYGLQFTNFADVNFTTYDNTATNLALQPGALYRRTIANERDFSLSGSVCGAQLDLVQCDLFGIERIVKPNIASQDGLLRLLYQDCECDGRLLQIDAVYNGGLEGNISGLYQQDVRLNFTAYNPFFHRMRERGQALEVSQLVVTKHLAIRDEAGKWVEPTGGIPDGEVFKLEYFGDELYAMGLFVNAGTTLLNQFGLYIDGAWTNAIGFVGGDVPSDFTVTPDRTFFLLEQTAANLSRVSYWRSGDPSRITLNLWTDSDQFRVIQSDNRGRIYVAGTKDRIERLENGVWSTLADGLVGEVFDIDIDRDGNVSAAGLFNTSNGIIGETIGAETTDFELFCEPTADITPIELDVQIKVVSSEYTTLKLTTDNNNVSDNDAIVSYAWSNDGNVNTAATRDVIGYDVMPAPVADYVTLTLVVTTASGNTLTQTIVYNVYDDDDGASTLLQFRASENKKEYSILTAIPFTASCCIETDDSGDCESVTTETASGESEDDPIASWDWSNDANANVYTTKTPTIDLTGVTPGGSVIVTLLTTTDSGATNENTITFDYSADNLLTESSKSEVITNYTIIDDPGGFFPYYNFISLQNGQWQGQLSGPATFAVQSINDALYVGNDQGINQWVDGEMVVVGRNIGRIRALTVDENEDLLSVGEGGAFVWDGFVLRDLGLRFQIGTKTNTIASGSNGLIAIGYQGIRALRSSGVTSIFYSGSVESKPRIVVRGEGRLLEVRNNSTGKGLLFDYLIGDGEYVEINLEGQPSAKSSYLQDIPFEVGTETEMFLLEGNNDIICFIDNATALTEASIISQPSHHGINALCCADDTDEAADVVDVPVAPCCGYSYEITDKAVGCYDDVEVGSKRYNPFTGRFEIRVA